MSPTDTNVNAAQAMTVHESFVCESVRGTPLTSPVIMVSVERQFNGYSKSESYTVGMISGFVSGTLSDEGQQTRASSTWDGNTLVIDTRSSVGAGGYSEHREEWSLDAQGNLLLTITDRAAGIEPMTHRLIYRRQH